MTTRTVATYRTENLEDLGDLIERLKEDERAGAMTSRNPNNSVQVKIGVGMDTDLDNNFDVFRDIMEDNTDLILDGVALGSNDTDNIGLARYFTVNNGASEMVDEYEEDPNDDERYWGEKAAAVMFSRHGINPNSSLFAPGASDVE